VAHAAFSASAQVGRRGRHPLALAAAGWLCAACGSSDLTLPGGDDVTPARISVVGGNGQQGMVGQLLAAPVVFKVTDAAGDPVEGAAVSFALTSAGDGAELSPTSATTGSDGLAETHVLLGDKIGLQTGEARVAVQGSDVPPVQFTALAQSPPPPPGNDAPDADFEWSCVQLTCDFTDTSTDGDGSVVGWNWEFGDGATSGVSKPQHTYARSGTYTVALTVTDDGGATDVVSSQVTVSAPAPDNQPPTAEFTVSCHDLACSFTDQSSDDDGTLVSWQWDFGDGATSSDRNPSHTYASAGHYQVQLTVRDDDGAQDSKTHDADAREPAPPPENQPPDADFDVHCDKLVCTFTDKSKDDDGVIVAWAWDFGDGGASSERNPVHTYADRGRFDVVLTVTDDDGATATKTKRADAKR
jgi:PKD repeat protein